MYFCISCVAFALLVTLASCRDYQFPMCPPKEWRIPGGKITTTGKVEYKLICQYGYTQPLLYNVNMGHICENGVPNKLPRRCIRKIFAHVTIQYGIAVEFDDEGKSVCNDEYILNRLKQANFKSILRLGTTGKKIQGQDNSLLEPSQLRANVSACKNFGDISYMRIHILNVPKGNGTKEEAQKFYYFVISETFKHLRKELEVQEYKVVRGEKSDIELFSNVAAVGGTSSYNKGTGMTGAQMESKLRAKRAETADTLDTAESEEILGFNVGETVSTSFLGKAYDGLFLVGKDRDPAVAFKCPKHLVLRQNTIGENLCVGCGKGWILREIKGEGYKCYPCGPGFYNEVDTSTECLACPVKYANAPWDAASIDECFKVTVPPYDRKKWTLIGYFLPISYICFLTIAVGWISKVLIGASSYERKPLQRKSTKP